ncbi:hypothetical protein ABLE92_22870 [Gordonia sp. VNQ95]|jgi:hypothetical protein|uniref:hypothetical protein n=1 Tax=Gordonia TaxID=2053 RepID=UPI0032B3DF98
MSFALITSVQAPSVGTSRRALRDAVSARIAEPGVSRLIVEPDADGPGDASAADAAAASDRYLAQVIAALMLIERLDVEVAYVAARPTPATRVYGLPHGDAARDLARTGRARDLPLIRDDAATVLVGVARHLGADGGPLHGESYADDHRLFRGEVPGIRIEPTPGEPGLRARLEPSGIRRVLGRQRWYPGRAVQTGGTNIVVEREGELTERVVKRSTYYRHHVDLKLVLPSGESS